MEVRNLHDIEEIEKNASKLIHSYFENKATTPEILIHLKIICSCIIAGQETDLIQTSQLTKKEISDHTDRLLEVFIKDLRKDVKVRRELSAIEV